MSDEADNANEHIEREESCRYLPYDPPKAPCTCGYKKAVTALRQALAQPEQEPVKCTCGYAIGHPLVSKCICTLRKPWVGLTVDEILDCYKDNLDRTMFVYIVQTIEAKLKEKNNG